MSANAPLMDGRARKEWIAESWGRAAAQQQRPTPEQDRWRLDSLEADGDAHTSILHKHGEEILDLREAQDANQDSLMVALQRVEEVLAREDRLVDRLRRLEEVVLADDGGRS